MTWKDEITKGRKEFLRLVDLEQKLDELAELLNQLDAQHGAMEDKLEEGTRLYRMWEDMIPPMRVAQNIIKGLDKADFKQFSEMLDTYRRANR